MGVLPEEDFLTQLTGSAEAMIGVVTLLVTVLLSLVGWWLKRKQITYRVHLDTPIGIDPVEDTSMIDVQLFNKENVVAQPSFALVRIANTGNAAIRTEDFEDPLTLEFGGRTVVDAEIVEGKALRKRVERYPQWPTPGETKLVLPKTPLNRKDRIKLLVLLSGVPDADAPAAVTCEAFVSGGRVVHDTTTGNGPSKRSLWLSGVALVVVTASVALVLTGLGGGRGTACAQGVLVVDGSSAFAPVAEKVADSYRARCSDADILVVPSPSFTGADRLVRGEAQIAMTDGQVTGAKYRLLVGHPVGKVTFAVLVNAGTGVTDLTQDQLREIYAGRRPYWDGAGANRVTVFSRTFQSGTRAAFDDLVLEAPVGQENLDRKCNGDAVPDGKVPLCEHSETSELLAELGRTPGGIGYAELSAAREAAEEDPALRIVTINGIEPADRGRYVFMADEFLHTDGPPAVGSLAESFIDYFRGDEGRAIVDKEGFGLPE
ncbi:MULTISPECIES: substrate-binding domain-containing protein [Actinosynnema]|uniref:substrate-binding domain-containing protein n=1 Tax=Actinosynnema TaxID=40566 RepID=UPI0020A5E583|nr:substrate-binding domain-containing protein [Actinosynnema pretiosum]MCP2094873.1 ABC-type phosphate transport system, substrate-binding protein [Actinosynnema pretiosum]